MFRFKKPRRVGLPRLKVRTPSLHFVLQEWRDWNKSVVPLLTLADHEGAPQDIHIGEPELACFGNTQARPV
jgi:hypothetical protein